MRQEHGAGCLEPAEFAARVRQLAIDAHRVLKSRTAAKSELVQLCRRIDELRQEGRVDLSREIDRWLDQANEQIEARWIELSDDQEWFVGDRRCGRCRQGLVFARWRGRRPGR